MIYGKTILIAMLIMASTPDTSAQTKTHEADADALFAQWDKPETPGCAVGVYRDGEIIFAKGYGLAQLEYDIPITPRTVFHVASVSKQFTDFAIAMLADQGKLSLDDDVRKYVPELPDFGPTITIRNLVHHTSGLRDQWDLLVLAGWRMDDVITRSDVLELIKRQRELNFEPGERYTYCNTGYTLLGLIVERVSGMDFPDWCEVNIFEPLDMNETHFHDDHRHVVPNRAYSYLRMGDEGFRNAVLSYAIAGATSLFTTVEDLGKWQHNFSTAQLGGEAVIEQMLQRGVLNDGESINYAFGLSHGEYKGLKTIGHSGGDAGFVCHLVRFPEQNLSVAVLANTPLPTSRLALQMAELFLVEEMNTESASNRESADAPQPAATEPTIEMSTETLAKFVGRFADPDEPRLAITSIRDGRLHLEVVGRGQAFLRPVGPASFRIVDVPVHLEVDFSMDGEAPSALSLTDSDGETTTLLPAVAISSEDLARYAGRYYSDELDVTYTIDYNGETLGVTRRKYGRQILQSMAGDRFGARNIYEFTRNAEGAIIGFKVSTGRVKGLSFRRIEQ